MADVEFEPLHGDNEEEEVEFMLDRPKRDSSAKKHKQKSAQLFQRKSVEKKDKTLVIEHSKALAAAASPTKSSGHFLHHHHSRPVEGLVGPGDIQFGSSPPSQDESVLHGNLSQSTGSIPQTVNYDLPAAWQQPMQLPLRPPQWTHVDKQEMPGFQQQQQQTLSQEKLTLLEKAQMMSPVATNNTGVRDGYVTPDGSERRKVFHNQPYNATSAASSPPRVASPIEKGPFSPPTMPLSSPVGRKFERSESWGPSSNNGSAHRGENWADFSKSFDASGTHEEEHLRRRSQSQVSTISEGSEGSYVSEIDDSVWRITDEQHTYYLTQFKKLQPNEHGVIKGPQARDFFLKSNLPVEILSRIWHLSDLNKDSALDLAEFCIAMHLVVAVKHEVELPPVLPASLLPAQEAKEFDASFPEHEEATAKTKQEKEDRTSEEERPQSPQQVTQTAKAQHWAKFEENAAKGKAKNDGQNEGKQAERGVEIPNSGEENFPSNSQSPDLTLPQSPTIKDKEFSVGDTRPTPNDTPSGGKADWHSAAELNATNRPGKQPLEAININVDSAQSPALKEAKKSSIGIARPRGSGAAINLIDTMPGQLLPPPDGKKSRKMMQVPHFITGHGVASPPTSPTARFSNTFTESHEFNQHQTVQDSRVVDSFENDVALSERDSTDGFAPPKLAPRKEQRIGIDGNEYDEKDRVAGDAVFRRSPSVKKGGRPRSYTADSRSSMESLVDVLPVPEANDFGIPPTPPPRKLRTHKRGSSLDLNKLFSTKSQQRLDQVTQDSTLESLPPNAPESGKWDRNVSGDLQMIPRHRPAAQPHHRSTSIDSAKTIAPPPKTSEGIIKDSRTPGYRKPAPPKPNAAMRTGRSKSVERTDDLSETENSVLTDRKPRNSRPMLQKRKRQQIQACIRQLKDKNAAISNVNSELEQELREVMETRTKLKIQLTKMKKLSE